MFQVNDEVQGEIQMTHRWKPGTTIYPHVHFALDNTAAGDPARVRWGLTYAVGGGHGTVFPAPGAEVNAEQVVSAAAGFTEYLLALPTITMTGKVESTIIILMLRRIAATANEYGDDVALLSWDAHVEVNSMGTHQESSPYTK
jgi:hypothetical protein